MSYDKEWKSRSKIGWIMKEHGALESRLTIVGLGEPKVDKNGRIRGTFDCLCECGNVVTLERQNVLCGKVCSCGCYKKEYLKATRSTHGHAHCRLYNVLASMKSRCYNTNEASYKDYGGRGIQICDEWKNDYQTFEKWAYANGYDENAKYGGCTIDRIDCNGNYEPSNCRWVTWDEQQRNKRDVITVCYNNKNYTIPELAKLLNVNYTTLYYRIKYSKLPEDKKFHEGTLRQQKMIK